MKSISEREAELAKRLGEMAISDELRQQILPYYDNDSLVVVSHDIAVVRDERHEHGSSGGVGMYDQVRVFCGSQSQMKEWQWRDRYSADNDRRDLAVHDIGAVQVTQKGESLQVEVELVNRNYGKRKAVYTFAVPEKTRAQTLSPEEQAEFVAKAQQEEARILARLNQLWKNTPQMPNRHASFMDAAYVAYRQPSVKQRELRPEFGVAAFVVEKQIDHRAIDRQIRYELYVLTAKREAAECVAEDHGYDSREGGAFLAIVEVASDQIVINTKAGKQTIQLL